MKIVIAGPGCPRCRMTARNVMNACAELDLEADISELYDYDEIQKLGIEQTPAVLIDDQTVSSGRIPTVPELKALLKQRAAAAAGS